jgi:hypothetical protein
MKTEDLEPETTSQTADAALVSDIDAFDTVDTADMTVLTPDGRLSQWVWTFAGPGHPKTIAQSNRIARERLHEESQKDAARTNGRKWKPVEESPDEVRAKNATFVIERLIGWRGATRGGQDFPFSVESARAILLDPRKGGILVQGLEFLGENASFTPRSPTP